MCAVHVAAPVCPYCEALSVLTSSGEIYRGVDYGPIWLCRPCNAYVGCHPGSKQPLGTLANGSLRMWRRRAHDALDPIWRNALERLKEEMGGNLPRNAKSQLRHTCYAQLAEALGIELSACHIGLFNEAQCRDAIFICQRLTGKKEQA